MVHARYGSKDAILQTLFATEYESKLSPLPDPDLDGLGQALAHLDRIALLYSEDRELLRAIFVLTFEAAKVTSQAHPYIQQWLRRAAHTVESGLRTGITDGSVRPEIDIEHTVHDFGAALLGIAYQWVMEAFPYDMATELAYLRARLIREYGSTAR